MNFLLVNPWIYDFAAYDFWLKPIGLLYISSVLKSKGHNVYLIDTLDRYNKKMENSYDPKEKHYGTGKFHTVNVEKPDVLKDIPRKFKRYGMDEQIFEDYLKYYKDEKIDAILLTSTMTYWYYGVYKTIEKIREIFPETPLFLGGIYTKIYKEHAENTFKPLNVRVVPGDANESLKEVFAYFGKSYEYTDWFNKFSPDYSHYDKLKYSVFTTSIGCPYKCTYCFTPIMWKYIYRDTDSIIKMLKENIEKFNTENIVFFDDAFLLHPDLENLLEKLSDLKVKFHLPNGIHAHRVNDKIAFLLKKADFRIIKLGYESSDPEMQKKTGGKVTNSDLINAVNNFKKYNFDLRDIGAYVISNLPGQKIEDLYNAVDFCTDLGIEININEFTPIPGTKDYEKLIKNNVFNDGTDPLLLNNTIIPYWWKEGLSADDLDKVKRYLKLKRR